MMCCGLPRANEPFSLSGQKKHVDRKKDSGVGVLKGPKRAKMAQNTSKAAQSGQQRPKLGEDSGTRNLN